MSPTGVSQNDQLPFATGYRKNGQIAPAWNHPFLIGSAGLRASSTDMLNFIKASLNLPGTPAIIAQAMKLTQTPYVSIKPHVNYGLGWQIDDIKTSHALKGLSVWKSFPAQRINTKNSPTHNKFILSKTGTTDGFHACIAIVPSKSTGVVVMINRMLPQGWSVVKKLAEDILRTILPSFFASETKIARKIKSPES